MTERNLPRAVTGTEKRLDALIDEIRALRDQLTPAPTPTPKDGDTIELREPRTPPPTHPGAPLAGPTGTAKPEPTEKRKRLRR